MAINFDALPGNKPFSIVQPGRYFATIESAEMKQGKDTSKPPYLNLKYKLKTKDGKAAGTIFDLIAESEHQLMQWKLGRFLKAIGVSFEGSFELKDLAKVCTGKEIIVETKIDPGQDGRPDRAVIDLIKDGAYWNVSEASDAFGEDVDIINASDAEDSTAKTAEDIIDEF